MIQKKQSAWNHKRQKNVIIAAAVLAVLIISLIVTNIVVGLIGEDDGVQAPLPEIDEELGEGIYGGVPVAYPTFESTQVQSVAVSYFENHKEDGQVIRNYSIVRPDKNSEFEFYYTDTNGIAKAYRPEIYYTDGFNYTELYARESIGYRINYLIIAVSVLYFDEKMELPEDENERAKMLNRYGLASDERQSISVSLIEGEGTVKEHIIHIGDKAIDGSGYYYTVDDRNYIYSSRTTDFDYALNGFTSFIHSRIVAQGLPMDSAQEPYFTQDYKQWKNVLHINPLDKDDKVIYGAKVIFTGSEEEYVYEDYDEVLDYVDDEFEPGLYGASGQFTFKLDSSASKNIRNILIGKPVGALDKPLSVTLVGDSNWAMLDGRYQYTVTSIDAILTEDGADITEVGTSVGDARYIKVTYDYKLSYLYTQGHFREYEFTGARAVIDLQKIDTGIPDDINSAFKALKGCSIGELSATEREAASFDITYTEENADKYDIKYVITDIDVIFEIAADGKVSYGYKVGEKSVVNFRYAVMHGSEVMDSGKRTVDLGSIDEDDGIDYEIKKAILGKELGTDYDIKAYTDTLYREYLSDYRTYTVNAIDYFVTESLVTSFEFVNASDRNPFHAEALFKNTLMDKNRIYALDSTASEYVVRLLGGITMDSSSSTSEGLTGTETVAVGLTAANMLEFGLYANTIYFELPRGIEDDKVVEGDYVFLDTLGFNLYISDLQPDGTRYIGSDMYDIVVKVDGEDFNFLDQSFVEFWARRSLAAVSYEKIDEMRLELYMDDAYGKYTLDVQHKDVWIWGDQTLTAPPPEGGQKYDQIRLEVTADDIASASDSLYKRMLLESGSDSAMLYSVYAKAMGVSGIPMLYRDTLDGVNFKSLLSVIYNTYYTGSFDPVEKSDEQKDIIKKENLLMKISFAIDDDKFNDTYYYEFYSADDRRIMVRIYAFGESANAVSDFYISPLAFKKIANGFLALLNGTTVVEDEGFAD